MLSGKRNENGKKKTTIALISKKATLHVQHTFSLYISLALFCTTTTWNFLVTRFMKEMSDVFLFSFFFFCRSFSPWWPLASCRYKISWCSSNKKYLLLFFVSRSSSFSRWASLACRPNFSFSLSFSLSVFQICGHDN